MPDTFIEEYRQDMLEESRREALEEAQMHRDFGFFLTKINFTEFQEMVIAIRKLCSNYGYDFQDVLDEV